MAQTTRLVSRADSPTRPRQHTDAYTPTPEIVKLKLLANVSLVMIVTTAIIKPNPDGSNLTLNVEFCPTVRLARAG